MAAAKGLTVISALAAAFAAIHSAADEQITSSAKQGNDAQAGTTRTAGAWAHSKRRGCAPSQGIH